MSVADVCIYDALGVNACTVVCIIVIVVFYYNAFSCQVGLFCIL